ncbi:hypothetical protein GN958_ATG07872 [Phytophthora infestans]|uniref:Uncharacterized protein n=1 Tax=Phytophthora infestans TaxID=4787 RepID=A0A8S9UQ07_PHYIN|nr:hypothetical protein GN958_ATG07872 [Phytophthora infestans]
MTTRSRRASGASSTTTTQKPSTKNGGTGRNDYTIKTSVGRIKHNYDAEAINESFNETRDSDSNDECGDHSQSKKRAPTRICGRRSNRKQPAGTTKNVQGTRRTGGLAVTTRHKASTGGARLRNGGTSFKNENSDKDIEWGATRRK